MAGYIAGAALCMQGLLLTRHLMLCQRCCNSSHCLSCPGSGLFTVHHSLFSSLQRAEYVLMIIITIC